MEVANSGWLRVGACHFRGNISESKWQGPLLAGLEMARFIASAARCMNLEPVRPNALARYRVNQLSFGSAVAEGYMGPYVRCCYTAPTADLRLAVLQSTRGIEVAAAAY